MLKLEQERKAFELELYKMGERAQKRDNRIFKLLAVAGILLAIAQVLTATPDSLISTLIRPR